VEGCSLRHRHGRVRIRVPTSDGFFVVNLFEAGKGQSALPVNQESNTPLGAQLFHFALGAVGFAGVAPPPAVSN